MTRLISLLLSVVAAVAFLIAGSVQIHWNEESPPAFSIALQFAWPEHSQTFAERLAQGDEPSKVASLWDAILISFGERKDKATFLDNAADAFLGRESHPEYRITAGSVGRRLGELIQVGPFQSPLHQRVLMNPEPVTVQ